MQPAPSSGQPRRYGLLFRRSGGPAGRKHFYLPRISEALPPAVIVQHVVSCQSSFVVFFHPNSHRREGNGVSHRIWDIVAMQYGQTVERGADTTGARSQPG